MTLVPTLKFEGHKGTITLSLNLHMKLIHHTSAKLFGDSTLANQLCHPIGFRLGFSTLQIRDLFSAKDRRNIEPKSLLGIVKSVAGVIKIA